MRKRQIKWWRWLGRAIAFGILAWVVGVMLLLAIIHRTGQIDEAQSADVIVVLGAGVTSEGRPGWALTRRSSHAAQLWAEGYAPNIICTGGQAPRTPRSEAAACSAVLQWRGVPESAIVLEDRSRSTEENALNTRVILEANGWDDVLLVSDSYHVFRADFIFGSVGTDVARSPVPAEQIRGGFSNYANSMVREIAALHWQVLKEVLNLPITHVPLG